MVLAIANHDSGKESPGIVGPRKIVVHHDFFRKDNSRTMSNQQQIDREIRENFTPSENRVYWRSSADLAKDPDFLERAKQEFPGFGNIFEKLGEAEFETNLDRRSFMGLSAAGLALGGLTVAGTGCYRRPDLKVLPYSQIPENAVPGLPVYYATSMPCPSGSFPLLVESHDGRPTKIEGHPKHPASEGAVHAHALASILDLYSPERISQILFRSAIDREWERKTWEDFDLYVTNLMSQFGKTQGKGLRFLSEDIYSPSLEVVKKQLGTAFPEAVWHTYEPIDSSSTRESTKIAFGDFYHQQYRFDLADRVLSLDCDFLGDANQVIHSKRFAKRRQQISDRVLPGWTPPRFYMIESNYSITGTMADHRLNIPALRIGDYLIALAKEILQQLNISAPEVKKSLDPGDQLGKILVELDGLISKQNSENAKEIPTNWIKEVAADLIEYRSKSIICIGDSQPLEIHLIGHYLNQLLDSSGKLIEFRKAPEVSAKSLVELSEAMGKGEVTSLFIFGGNPVENAPADLGFAEKLDKVKEIIRFSLFPDETSEKSHWQLPLAHYLEVWGDGLSADGVYTLTQPLIAPIFDGRSVLAQLILLTNFENANTYTLAHTKAFETIQKTFAAKSGKEDLGTFNHLIQLGFWADPERKIPESRVLDGKTLSSKWQHEAVRTRLQNWVSPLKSNPKLLDRPDQTKLEICFRPDYRIWDGRFVTNRWLMEWPDPITKLSWDNALLISPRTAIALGQLKNGDLIELETETGKLEIPIFILPGHADHSGTLTLGFGKMKIHHVQEGGGFSVYPLRNSKAMHQVLCKRVEKTNRTTKLVTTQEWGTIPEGRDEIIHEKSIIAIEREKLVFAESVKPSSQIGKHPSTGSKNDHNTGNKKQNNAEAIELEQNAPLAEKKLEDPKAHFQSGYKIATTQKKNERIRLDLAYPEVLEGPHQWGMVVDLNSCTGCSACMIACQSENNLPVVGRGEVERNREMHWMRVDRYFTSNPKSIQAGVETVASENPQIVSQPMMCQHCEAAPCESVCPVNAAVHSPEGLNLQVYNRCIGTRYCANNCPYKVRRFNWFDFNQRQLDELRIPTPFSEKGMAELMKMSKNPDVTVRSRGVMEKCTYCIQRLERAKIGAKLLAAKADYAKPANPLAAGYDILRAEEPNSDRQKETEGGLKIVVPDGVIQTACQQACPSKAIVFGNVADETSKVFQLKQRQQDYLVLGSKNTKPRTSYYPRLRNPNPRMGIEERADS